MPSLSRCVFGCVTKGVSIHNFPNPSKFPERFRQWVNLVGAPLFGISDAEIYKKYKVCDVHFTNEDRNRNKRLNAIAVPSLCISHVGYKQLEMDQHDVKPSTSKSMCPSVKESPGLCRCCLSEGGYKDLGSEYTWMDETEVYADMLLECFDISISQYIEGPNDPKCLICEVCITRLRDACNFKKQVLESEKKFVDMVGRGEFKSEVIQSQEDMKVEIVLEPQGVEKTEVEYLDENIDYDVIQYQEDMKVEMVFEPQGVEETEAVYLDVDINYDVKEESPPPQPVTKKKTITRSSPKNNKQMKSLINKELSFDTDKTQINKKDSKIVKNSKITVKNDLETNLSWTCRLMERDFKCTECGKRFYSKRGLNSHMIKHTGERKYTCDTCHKSYTRRDILTKHMKKHNNDQQLICEVCNTTFIQKCHLRSHLLTHHGISMAASDIPIS